MFWRKSKAEKNIAKESEVPIAPNSFLVANWKCHKTYDDAIRWFDAFAIQYTPNKDLTIVIAPPLLYLQKISEYVKALALENVFLAAQDVSPFPRGSYTGTVSADMLKGVADYVIVGHSERRRYFKESVRNVANKAYEAIEVGIIPLVCIDDDLTVSQLNALNDIESKKVMIGYCPVDALNFKIPEEHEKVRRMAEAMKNNKPDWPVIYGGSVTPENASSYMRLDGLVGLFVGSASLEVDSFVKIIKAIS